MMIQVKSLNGKVTRIYKDYEALFQYLVEHENLKLIAKNPNFQDTNWSFVIYAPSQVASIYTYRKSSCEAVQEAFTEGLSLIEICTGDYENPRYIALTPNIDTLP